MLCIIHMKIWGHWICSKKCPWAAVNCSNCCLDKILVCFLQTLDMHEEFSCFSSYSVIIMRFVLANRLECVYLLPTTGYLLAPFLRVKQRSRLWRSLLKSQVKCVCVYCHTLLQFLGLTGYSASRGPQWCHTVPSAWGQEEEQRFLLPGVRRSQNSCPGPSPANEWQSEGVG